MATKTELNSILDELHSHDMALVQPLLDQVDNLDLLVPLLQRLTELRETISILEDPDLMEELEQADQEIASGKVTALEDL